mmetsp:Transcript_78821/g.217995  ORF Transcript_78821/g.217995 Transcript_78821/m.217995 type:complete len:322 (-) Transcript_78821:52-1017(-)
MFVHLGSYERGHNIAPMPCTSTSLPPLASGSASRAPTPRRIRSSRVVRVPGVGCTVPIRRREVPAATAMNQSSCSSSCASPQPLALKTASAAAAASSPTRSAGIPLRPREPPASKQPEVVSRMTRMPQPSSPAAEPTSSSSHLAGVLGNRSRSTGTATTSLFFSFPSSSRGSTCAGTPADLNATPRASDTSPRSGASKGRSGHTAAATATLHIVSSSTSCSCSGGISTPCFITSVITGKLYNSGPFNHELVSKPSAMESFFQSFTAAVVVTTPTGWSRATITTLPPIMYKDTGSCAAAWRQTPSNSISSDHNSREGRESGS